MKICNKDRRCDVNKFYLPALLYAKGLPNKKKTLKEKARAAKWPNPTPTVLIKHNHD